MNKPNPRDIYYKNKMDIDKLITESIQSVLLEVIEGNSPDEVIFDEDKYVALEDASITLLYYKGKWLHNAETHRDIISLTKYGCEEWQLEDYYSREKSNSLKAIIDKLWSSNDVFSYPSRIFYAKGNAKKNGIDYILISWDYLDENQIVDMCRQLGIDRNKLVHISDDL